MQKIYSIKNNKILNYYELLAEKTRNEFFLESLKDVAKDKVVLDLGTGTGIFSHYALACGAKFVYAVERDFEVSLIAKSILSYNFDKSKFKVINSDFWDASLYQKFDKQIDVMVTETVGHLLLDEGMIETWDMLTTLPYKVTSIPDAMSADLLLFDNISHIDFVSLPKQTNITNETNLSEDDVLDPTFFKALSEVDKTICNKMISDTVQKSKLALIKGNPTTTKENIFYFAYSNEKMESNVSTIVMFDTPCIAALNFKLRYKNLELNFIDSKKQNWRYNPTFVVTKPGNYKLSYKNRKVENINKSWTLEFLG